MKTIALLTGRGNNSLKDKNILDVLGHPVLYYPAHAARQCAEIDGWYCSSDDRKILDIAQAEGYRPILRPAELALPTAQTQAEADAQAAAEAEAEADGETSAPSETAVPAETSAGEDGAA